MARLVAERHIILTANVLIRDILRPHLSIVNHQTQSDIRTMVAEVAVFDNSDEIDAENVPAIWASVVRPTWVDTGITAD